MLGIHSREQLIVTVKDGIVIIRQLQVEGKSKISGAEFINGYTFYENKDERNTFKLLG
jgi:methionyl-tRNA formyltransferase